MTSRHRITGCQTGSAKSLSVAFCLSLWLVSCQALPLQNPPSQLAQTQRLQPVPDLPAASQRQNATLNKLQTAGTVSVQGQRVSLQLQLPAQRPFQTQALNLAAAAKIVATVRDSHGQSYTPVGAVAGKLDYPVDGVLNLNFENVVPDPLLFVALQVEDATTAIPQAELSVALKHTGTAAITTGLDFQSSAVARTLDALMGLDLDRARHLELTELNTLLTAITGRSGVAPDFDYAHNHPSLVLTESLAAALQNNEPSELLATAANFRGQGATVNLNISGLAIADQVQVQITDAASAIRTAGNGSHSGTAQALRVTPGTQLDLQITPVGTPTFDYTYTLDPANLPELAEAQEYTLNLVAIPDLSGLNVLRVKFDATGANDGSSWEDAFAGPLGVQQALAAASAGQQIWVAAGTYLPHLSSTTASFQMKSQVDIYGGFAGGEIQLEQRDWEANPVILSGDLNGNDDCSTIPCNASSRSDNSQTLVLGANNATLDGVIISGATNRGMRNLGVSPTLNHVLFRHNSSALTGAGMHITNSSPILNHVTFLENHATLSGGGIQILGDSFTPVLNHVTFSRNVSDGDGGGLYVSSGSTPSLNHVTFSQNTANRGGGMYTTTSSHPELNQVSFQGNFAHLSGGGMYNANASASLKNVYFSHNTSNTSGGAIYTGSTALSLDNVTFSQNSSPQGGGILADSSTTLRNTLFLDSPIWGTVAVNVEAGNFIADTDPFVALANPSGCDGIPRTADDGLRLTAAAAAAYPGITGVGIPTVDILGQVRADPPRAGAYEAPGTAEVCP